MKILTTKLELRAEYENRTGSRCKILMKEINRDNRKNLILVCEVTKSTTMAIGSIFRTNETNFSKDWRPIKSD